MEPIFILLILLLIFIVAGAIAAFVALARTGGLMQSVKSYRNIIADLSTKLEAVRLRLSLLEKDSPPIEIEPPPETSRPPDAPTAVSLAQDTSPPAPEELPQTVISRDEVELVEPPESEPLPPPLPAAPVAAPRRDWAGLESAAGKRWLTLAGVVILFLSAAFFLKHAFDVGWIGPGVQVLFAVITGVVLLAVGEYFLRREMRPLGQGLIGGGIMVLYAALFAAYSPDFYKEPVIESQKLTFVLMCIVTIVGMALAVRHDAISISFLAILGGMLTPILVSTGTDARDSLFSYLLLLDLGVLGVAFYKKWRALDILAFVGTVVLFWGWYQEFGAGAPVGPPLAWLATFWAVFAIVPVAYHVRHGMLLTVERLVMSLANATYGFGFAYLILADRHGDLAWVAMVMSAVYLAMGVLARLRSGDAKAMFGFISLSMMFVTLFIPLHFALNGITLAWAAEAVVLVYLGFLFDYRPVRVGGFITLLLGTARVFAVHFPAVTWHGESFTAFANANFWTMMCAPAASALVAVVGQTYRRKFTLEDKQIQIICTIGAGLLAMVIVSFEMDQWFRGREDMSWAYREYLRNCSLGVLWSLGATAFLAGMKSSMALPLRIAGLVPLGGAILLISRTFTIYPGMEQMLFINSRFGTALLVCGVMWAYSLAWSEVQAKRICSVLSSYASVALLCAEMIPWVWRMSTQWGVDRRYTVWWVSTILLSLCAVIYLVFGRLKRLIEAYSSGLAPLAIAWICGLQAYLHYHPDYTTMFFNLRFIAVLIAVGVILAWAAVNWRDRRRSSLSGAAVFSLYVWFTLSLLALLSAEPAGWLYRNITDPNQSAWASQMSVTIVWGLYASAMLSIGFRRRVMPLRLAALALFGLTAVKLLLIDMASVRQIYRIISFFVMGMLMVAASYFYHKAEKLLKESEQALESE